MTTAAREATITELNVSIKALRIDKRSLTVAVFNQLAWGAPARIRQVGFQQFDVVPELDAEIWGWVNRSREPDHDRTVIFSQGGMLMAFPTPNDAVTARADCLFTFLADGERSSYPRELANFERTHGFVNFRCDPITGELRWSVPPKHRGGYISEMYAEVIAKHREALEKWKIGNCLINGDAAFRVYTDWVNSIEPQLFIAT